MYLPLYILYLQPNYRVMSINRTELTTNIRNYIELNKALMIPYVGKVSLSRVSAKHYLANDLLDPPDRILFFTSSEEGIDDGFIQYQQKQTGKSMQVCKDEFLMFARSVNADLDILGRSKITGLGAFSRLNNSTKFLSEQGIVGRKSYGLPQIKVNPLSLLETESTSTVKKVNVQTKLARRNYSRAIVNVAASAAMFLIFLVAFKYIDNLDFSKADLSTTNAVEIDQPRLNQKPEMVLTSNEAEELIPGAIEKGSQSASCALILGSFSKKENAVSLQKEILLTDYQLYTEEFHEFYRIGILFDCEEISSSTFKNVEQDFGIDPWLRVSVH